MKTLLALLFVFLTLNFFSVAMQRIALNEAAVAKLKPIPRNGLYGQKRLDIVDVEMLQQQGRTFVGKMDSYGYGVRYFLIKNNQSVETLVQYARNNATWDPDFFYLDGAVERVAQSGE